MADTNRRAVTFDLEKEKQLRFPFFFQSQNDAGKVTMEYFDPQKPQLQTSFSLDYNGSHSGSQPGINQSVSSVQNNQYNSKGMGTFTDGNINQTGEGTRNDVTKGDTSSESGGTAYSGSQKSIGGSKEGGASILHDTVYTIAKKDIVETIEGNEFSEIQGDNIRSTTGNKYDIVSEGEYGIHVQSGNMDVNVQSGKFKLFAGNEIILESAVKLTIKVGSSEIVVEPAQITVKSSQVKFEKA